MLPESNAASAMDDLEEIAITVNDGGDGIFNGGDKLLFYAQGPDHWLLDSNTHQFRHSRNLYTNKAFYFITIGGQGKGVSQQASAPQPLATVTSFDDHYFHELDTINLQISYARNA